MNISKALSSEIKRVVKDVEAEMLALIPNGTEEESFLYESMRYSSMAKAKRIRAFLVVETSKLFGVSRKEALKVASAIEFVHAYSLIHDDLPSMDDANTRRGQPANHIRYDEATAILTGDALIPLAYEIISNPSNISDAELRSEIALELSKTIGAKGMVAGQILDLLSEKRSLSFETMKRMEFLKTGKMFIFSCLAGAILGKASKEERKALYNYATKFGIVFQITDDILDVIGDEKLVGKPLRRDEANKKTTFISMYGLEEAQIAVDKLTQEACDELKIFNKDVSLLIELAQYLAGRTH
ncbi:MAG: polyprenyl synthetase family protein [Alphaproteobacteria bacterium]|jgi:farnesyl diphosphate synthase|nr:polyprenyl synthetase family protein [Alphaproteobacteria bacterium]